MGLERRRLLFLGHKEDLLRKSGCTSSGIYQLSSGIKVYCDMKTAGGGWQLLLTKKNPKSHFSGSVSPFLKDLNPNSPSTTQPYARNWQKSGLVAESGDEFLIMSKSNKDYVRFMTSK